jgi:hypothetical protein
MGPLLANVYLHPVDDAIVRAGFELTRHADDRAPRRRGKQTLMVN